MSNQINTRQGTDRGILLQQAADGSHARAQRIEDARVAVSVILGISSAIAMAVPATAPAIAAVGAGWSFVSLVLLAKASGEHTDAAARAQEHFDSWLFDLPRSASVGERLSDEEAHRRARWSRTSVDRMRTWYPDVSGLSQPYAVLACQRENLTWDWRLRRRWASVLTWFAYLWVALGLALGATFDLSTRAIVLQWLLPSSSMVVMSLQMARANRDVATEKEQLAKLVRDELDAATAGEPDPDAKRALRTLSRSIQDGLFQTRRRAERVPGWFYERFRSSDEEDMHATVAALRDRIAAKP